MLSQEIKQKALQLGYLACGIIPINIFDDYKKHLDERVKSFPESKELYDPLYDNVCHPENAKSVIVCTQRYNQYNIPKSLNGLYGKCYLFDSRVQYSTEYRVAAEFNEYIKLCGINILQCRVPDRLAAAKAGLGKIARNNFLYDPEHGSYIWINALVIDKELEYDDIQEDYLLPACNDGCGECIKACPTKALSGKYSMNRGKCITHLLLTKNIVDDNTRTQMGLWIYGCDKCQDACPINKDKFNEADEFPLLKEYEEYLSPQRILEMDDDTYLNIVNPRFWYAGKDGLLVWKRNALLDMINSGDKKYFPFIKKYSEHTDMQLRETALWGCDKLGLR